MSMVDSALTPAVLTVLGNFCFSGHWVREGQVCWGWPGIYGPWAEAAETLPGAVEGTLSLGPKGRKSLML